MTTIYYPVNAPTKQTLQRLLNTHRKVRASVDKTLVHVAIDGNVVLTLPESYHVHIQRFVWREEAIRLVLARGKELHLPADVEENLNMFIWYMDNVFKRIAAESRAVIEERSNVFDRYLLTEWNVRRHEPIMVRAWRRKNDTILEDGNVNEYDWEEYEEELGGVWTGARVQYVMDERWSTLKFARNVLQQIMTIFNPPVVIDPDFGYTYNEHLENLSDREEERPGSTNKTGDGKASTSAVGKGKEMQKKSDINGSDSEMDVDADEEERISTRSMRKRKAKVMGNGKEKQRVEVGKQTKWKGKSKVHSQSYISDSGSDFGSS